MPNIYNFDHLYRRTKGATGLTGSTVRISLGRIGAKTVRVLTHATIENLTSAFTKLRIGIKNVGIDYYLDELQTIAANELVVSKSDILLGEGDQFFTEFTGTTTGDVLVMNCIGWEQAI